MKLGIALVLLLTAAPFTSGQLPDPNQGPGGPILVITSSSTYGTYYAEILRTEGLNEFAVAPIGSVTAATLSAYDVAILAPTTLTSAQVTMLSDWVIGGGNLIAMQPDAQLGSLLGLTSTGSTLSNAYLLVDTSTDPGNGIVGQPIQFHGTANRYTLNGAASIATLYTNFTTATSNPAVTLRSVGTSGGHAAAFAYDLATSLVYMRQGNPAWATQERDGLTPKRSDDKFYGNASGDSQPDWVDLNNEVSIPQADEQQRLFANLILQMNLGKKPLPRFWYFPRGKKAVVIMTGDDHANGGTAGRFDQYIAASPSGCNVANWECIRATSYIFIEPQNLSNSQAMSYTAQGFEVGLHVNTNCADFTPTSLNTFYSQQISNFSSSYPGIPAPATQRHHCIAWSDWVTGAKTQLQYGIRLDTSYYFWPPGWAQNRPGYFTGSAMPMRFADLDGTIIDVYNATTQMTDESGQTYPFTSDALLNAALGPQGYYGAYVVNAHTDSVNNPVSDGVLSSAVPRGVPIVSSIQMLKWLDGRNSSSFGGLAWNGSILSFNVTAGSGSNGLQGMLPTHSSAGLLTAITGPSGAVTFTLDTIKGIEYALFSAAPGAYTANYAADTTAPTVTSTSPASGASGVNQNTTVSATFSEAIDPTTINGSTYVLRVGATAVPASVSYTASTRTAVLTPNSPLAASTSYTATLTTAVKDLSGNALASNYSWSFMTAAAPTCPCTAWASSATPSNPSVNDPNAVELGVKFKVDLNGFISGVRFYKGSTNTGVHVGSLWSSSGQLLASATFSGETASGWQQVNFSSPVAVTANTVYVASYHTNTGRYAGDNGYFASSGIDNPPVHLLRDGVSGGNGVYAYSSSSIFPTNTFQASNYWVDVVFILGAPPTLTSIAVTPANPTIQAGATQQFTATGTYSDNSTQNITNQVTWTSSNTSVATINSAGLATGVNAGSSTITAAQSGVTGNTTLTVQPGPLTITTSSLPNGTVGAAYSATLAASGGTPPYTWSITAGALPGGLTLNATSGGISGTPTASGTFNFTVRAADSATPQGTATKSLSIVVAGGGTGCTSNCTIWTSTTTPARPDDGPDSPVELGVKFRADTNGTITGIRFYKASTNTGTHVANLWSSTGQNLATATFSGETVSGWQQVNFAPVSITANTVYVASYHTNVGHYSADLNYFASTGVDNAPLHALQNNVSGFNGVYAYGAGSNFPTQGFNSSNYWVDVVFSSGPAPTLTSIAVTPANPTIQAGATQQFTATGTYSDNSTQNITSQVTWTSSNTSVATINSAALATGVNTGSSTISAAQSGVTGNTTLTVQPGPLTITTNSLPNGTLGTGYSQTLAASGGAPPYTWSITTGALPGGLTLNATSGGISGTPTASGTFNFTVRVADSATPQGTATKSLSIVVAGGGTGCSSNCTIWTSTTVPARPDDGPDSAVELGVKFRADRNGTIIGIRFYKASTNTGTHVANLWSSTGQRLATVTFSGETASGWQQVNFGTPVSITANTVYVASYHTNVGHYSADLNYFANTGVDNAPLHALQNGVSGFNGVYAYGAGSNFPSQGFNSSNYWVDVVFQ